MSMRSPLALTVTALSLLLFTCTLRGQSSADLVQAQGLTREVTLKASLARDCFVLREGKLGPIAPDSFAKTRLFVVYYTHITCSLCVPVTKKLNAWLEAGKAPDGVSFVLGYRAEADNAELTAYVAKSGVLFPALDTKWIRACRANAAVMHPFYADRDEGAPRFRFFRADGTEIDPTEHGAPTKFGGAIMNQLDDLLPKMLK